MITDGVDFVVHPKTFDQMEAEVFVEFLNKRKVHPLTGQIKSEFKREFIERLRTRVESHFELMTRKLIAHLREKNIEYDDENGRERYNTFRAQAERIKSTQYTVEIERRASALVRIPLV